MAAISNDWNEALKGEYSKSYYRDLYRNVVNAYKTEQVFPPSELSFHW